MPTQEELLRISDPNYQRFGFTAPTIPRQDVSIISSREGEKITNKNLTALDEITKATQDADVARKAEEAKKAETAKAEADKKAEMTALGANIASGEGMSADGVKGQWVANPHTGTNEFFPQGSTIAFRDTPETVATTSLDKEKADLDSQMTNLKRDQDALTSSLIDSINSKYTSLIEQQKEANKRAMGIVTTAGIRFGTARYAPEIQASILSDEETQGLQKISKLESEKISLIIEAKQASLKNNFTVLNAKIEDYNKRKDEQQKELMKLKEKQDEKDKENKKEERKQKQDIKITELYASGVTNEKDILSALVKAGFTTATLDDIDKAVKVLEEKKIAESPDIKKFHELFPDMDVSTPAGQRQYLDWKAREGEAGRADEKGTEQERVTKAVSNFNSALVVGATYEGINVIGQDGFIDPRVWKAALADAPAEGLSRKQFIENFGYLVNTKNDKTLTEYGLTAAEKKLITGEL